MFLLFAKLGRNSNTVQSELSPIVQRMNFGVFRVKNHDFTPKNHIFSNFFGGGGGGGRAPGAPLPPPPP